MRDQAPDERRLSARVALAAAPVVVAAVVLMGVVVMSGDDANRQSRPAGAPSSQPGVRSSEDPSVARHAVTEEGVPFAFWVPTVGWERFSSISADKSAGGPISINKSAVGP